MFSDQWPLAFVREDDHGFTTTVYRYDPEDPTAPWVKLDAEYPGSFGVFAPVQTDNGWSGVSWTAWYEAALWYSESALGPWTWVEGFHTEQRTYEHGLNVVDGSLIWRWSNAEGSQRPSKRAM